jgi:transcriptional regulator of acetoin/glycerol metabolism
MKNDLYPVENNYNALQARASKAPSGWGVTELDYDESKTMRAWETLLSGGDDRASSNLPVRSLIHASWSRCATGGIDAQQHEAPLESGKDAVENLARANAELLSAAQRSFGAIGRLLDGTGAMLVLADSDGVLIDAIGDKRTIFDGMDIHLAIGGKWTEDVVGTNGIGTALWTGEPVFVHAAEHFCAGIKSWTCAGAPIRDPFDGKIIGVVDLSGQPSIFRPHNIALVATAAREIEMALAEFQSEERARLLEAFIASASNYRSPDGLMIIDRHGRAIYSNNVPDAETKCFVETIRQGSRSSRLPELTDTGFLNSVTTALPNELQSYHANPLRLNGSLRGVALVFPTQIGGKSVTTAKKTASQRLHDESALIVGESEALLAAVDIACRVAESGEVTSLLIEGETGVGKELFARLVHVGSQRTANDPFIAMNCGAITKDLFGSELFGHVAGAFTGSARDGKPGVFELANGGVLSLDEIGEMPLEIQPYLLRVLEERVVQRLGDSRSRPVDVRLVASTNRSLKQEVEAGRFRRDLYYRISTVAIHVPPLRERGTDVLLLVEHFNRKIAARKGGAQLAFSNEALEALLSYPWPGNVRELKNLVERLHILTRSATVGLPDLPAEIIEWDAGATGRNNSAGALGAPAASVYSFEDAERQAIKNALVAERGNLSKVAHRLGVSRPTLYRKLEQYGIQRGYV